MAIGLRCSADFDPIIIPRRSYGKETIRWQVDPVASESRLVTLLARLDWENKAFQDFHVFPNMDRSKRFTIGLREE